MDNNLFYCYSLRLKYFLKAMGLIYISSGINKNTNIKYCVFEKSKKLDDLIALWNGIKHKY